MINSNSKPASLSTNDLTLVEKITTYFRTQPQLKSYLKQYQIHPVVALIYMFRRFNQDYTSLWNGSNESYKTLSPEQTQDFFLYLFRAYDNLALNWRRYPRSLAEVTLGLIQPEDFKLFFQLLKNKSKIQELEQILEEDNL